MKYRHLFWAIQLIAVGLLILVGNLGWLHVHWSTLWQLWPLILIVWGISILPMKDLYKYVALGAVLVLTFVFFNRLTEPRHWFRWDNRHFSIGEDWDENEPGIPPDTYHFDKQTLTIPSDSITKKAILNLDAAAGDFKVEGLSTDLVTVNKQGNVGDYSLVAKEENGVKVINLQLQKSEGPRKFRQNEVEIRLNQAPVWEFNFDIGAASISMNLKDYCIDTAKFDAGASSIEMTIGDKSPVTYLEFNAGASSIEVNIPKESACEIRTESFLASRDFPGFSKKSDGVYRSDNFGSGKNKIYIRVKTAVSSIDVSRY